MSILKDLLARHELALAFEAQLAVLDSRALLPYSSNNCLVRFNTFVGTCIKMQVDPAKYIVLAEYFFL